MSKLIIGILITILIVLLIIIIYYAYFSTATPISQPIQPIQPISQPISQPTYKLLSFMWGSYIGSGLQLLQPSMTNVTIAANALLNPTTGIITGPSINNLGDPTPGVKKIAMITYTKLGVVQPVMTWVEGSSSNIQLP